MKKQILVALLFFVVMVQAQLSGDYYIPQGANSQGYATLAAAITALNTSGVSGTVNFLIDGNLSETGANLSITRNDLTAVNNVVIKPAPTKTPTITISGCTATAGATQYSGITINAASYITIDGSNNGSTSKDMTIKVNDATNGRYVINLYTNTDNITIKNAIIGWQAIPTANTSTGIFANGLAAGVADNVTIQNNSIGDATFIPYYAVRITGYGTGSVYCTNIATKNNILYGQIRPAYYFVVGSTGNTSEISGNDIYSGSSSITGVVVYGMLLNQYGGTVNIYKNKVLSIRTNNASAQGLFGLSTLTAQSGNVINVYNNVFTNFQCLNATANTTPVYGIYFQDAANINLYNNSINLSPVNNTTGITAGLRIASTTVATVKNNAISNSYNTATSYAFYSAASSFTSDNNDLYVSGASAQVGFASAANQTTFATWKSTTSQDAASINADPLYTSVSDLSVGSSSPLINAGTNTGITTDILGNSRVGNYDIGAYEYQATPPPSAPTASAATNVSYTSFSANWSASSGATSYYIDVATDNGFSSMVSGYSNLNVGNVTTYSVTGLANTTTYYYRVRAYNGDNSSNSGTISATTLTPVSYSGNYYVGDAGTKPGGGDPDFATLKAACDALNIGNITGNVTVLITSNLTEASNVAIGVNTNSFTLTFKPAPSVTPTINFTQSADNSGPSGLWLVGSSSTSSWDLVQTSNLVIDGSNTTNGTTRDLSLTCTDNSVAFQYGIRVVGNTDGVVIKNMNITITETGSTSSYGVLFAARNNGADQVPDNGVVENCNIVMTGITAGQGIAISHSSAPASGTTSTGMSFRNNTITAETRGIFINGGSAFSIYGNTINVNRSGSGSLSHGIYVFSVNGVTSHTCNIYNNKFPQLQTANTGATFGIVGITIEQPGTYNIYNNMIAGFSNTAATTLGIRSGIRITTASASTTVNAYYNSINIVEDANITASDAAGIAALYIGASYAGTVNVKNNIFIVNSTPTCYGIYRGGTSGTVTSNYNDVYTPGTGGNFGDWGGTAAATLSAWQTASGGDANSKSKNVNFTSATDLHVTGASNGDGDLSANAMSSPYTTDIDGATRDNLYPYMGADEGSVVLPVELTSFTAAAAGKKVEVKWTTATEHDNYGFEVERKILKNTAGSQNVEKNSSNSGTFVKTSFVSGSGNTNAPQEYSYTDNASVNGTYVYRLKQIDRSGAFTYSPEIEVQVEAVPAVFTVSQNYPNPFNPSTTIEFSVAVMERASLKVYDIAGREVQSLFNDVAEPGQIYSVRLDGSRLASGVYIYVLQTPSAREVKKMSLLK